MHLEPFANTSDKDEEQEEQARSRGAAAPRDRSRSEEAPRLMHGSARPAGDNDAPQRGASVLAGAQADQEDTMFDITARVWERADADRAVALLRAHFPVVQDARRIAPQTPPFVDGRCDEESFSRCDLIPRIGKLKRWMLDAQHIGQTSAHSSRTQRHVFAGQEEANRHNPIAKVKAQPLGKGINQGCFAHPARAANSDDPSLLVDEEARQIQHFLVPTNETLG